MSNIKNFINDEIKIDFKTPTALQDVINSAEEADKENDLGSYMAYADMIDTIAKNCYTDGKLSREQWGFYQKDTRHKERNCYDKLIKQLNTYNI